MNDHFRRGPPVPAGPGTIPSQNCPLGLGSARIHRSPRNLIETYVLATLWQTFWSIVPGHGIYLFYWADKRHNDPCSHQHSVHGPITVILQPLDAPVL
jgi:hypothetical protein